MTKGILPRAISGLREIAADYDALICDIWGVVHDGHTPFQSAVEALTRFRRDRKPVVLLTNAPRLASDISAQFDRIGVSRSCCDAIVTSGEAARAELAARAAVTGHLAFFNLGPERDKATYEGLPVSPVGADEAELVLCTGLFNDEVEGPDDYTELLQRFRSRDLLFICANPDVSVRRGGVIIYCAGALARRYEEMGGKVVYFGKPYRPIFEAALSTVRTFAPAERILFIGDGLETDIRGANLMNLDSLFIAGGLAAAEIGNLPPQQADERLKQMFAHHGVRAHARMDALRW
jgi:HAD superfamily hydrolase (TIGR01459 family)